MGRRSKKDAAENPSDVVKTPAKAPKSIAEPAPPSTPPPTTPTFTLNASPKTPKGRVWKKFVTLGHSMMLAVTPKLSPTPVASTSAISEASPLSEFTITGLGSPEPLPGWLRMPPSPTSPIFRSHCSPFRCNITPTRTVPSFNKRTRVDSIASDTGSPFKELKRLRLATPSEDGTLDSDSDAASSAITSLTSVDEDGGQSPSLKETFFASSTFHDPADSYPPENATQSSDNGGASVGHEIAPSPPPAEPLYLDSAVSLSNEGNSLRENGDMVPVMQDLEAAAAGEFPSGESVGVQTQPNAGVAHLGQTQRTGLPTFTAPPHSHHYSQEYIYHPQVHRSFNGAAPHQFGFYGQQFATTSSTGNTPSAHEQGAPLPPQRQYPDTQHYQQAGHPHQSLPVSMNAQLNGYWGNPASSYHRPTPSVPAWGTLGCSVPPYSNLPLAAPPPQASTSSYAQDARFVFESGVSNRQRRPRTNARKSTRASTTTGRSNGGGPSTSSVPLPPTTTASRSGPPSPLTQDQKAKIWCGHQTAVNNPNTGWLYGERCAVLIERTKAAIEEHYVNHHGMQLTAAKQKCNWIGSCGIKTLGERLAEHIVKVHINGGERVCESKRCTLPQASDRDWCGSDDCEGIAPVNGNINA